MADWIIEDDSYGNKRTLALELNDKTRLKNYDTVLENKYGEEEQFEVFGDDRKMIWYGWGPHNITVHLYKNAIQSMFDNGDMKIVTVK